MTKLSMEWKRLCRINAKVRVNTEESAVKPEPELKNTIGCNLNPSDGPGKPNRLLSIAEGLRKGRVIIQQDFDNLEAELQKAHARIAKLQRKQMGNNNKIALARFRIANLEQIIEEIQVRHQADKESLLNAIYELKNSQKGPSNY
ncbi:hypothetical protein Tco_0543549 [Tanacetum coccineum]